MKFNKTTYLIIGTILIVLLGIAGFLIFSSQNNSQTSIPTNNSQEVKKLTPEDIGLTLTPEKGGKAIEMDITKLDGVKSIEYELSYDAEETSEGETAIVPKGVAGSAIEVKNGEPIRRTLDLGTCSRNVCRYDKVQSDVKIVIRVNYKDGLVGSVETSLSKSKLLGE